MTAIAEQLLREAGWSPGRRVDASAGIETLVSEGYEPWPSLIAFLEEYSGLTLRFEVEGVASRTWFDAAGACERFDNSWVEGYEARTETAVAPVGFGHLDHMVILMGADGRWFGAYDDVLGVVGHDVLSMVESLTRPKSFVQRL
ncbi:MAG TPA: SUKH-3 domain-containing protein [Acidimicrobiales bacterium]